MPGAISLLASQIFHSFPGAISFLARYNFFASQPDISLLARSYFFPSQSGISLLARSHFIPSQPDISLLVSGFTQQAIRRVVTCSVAAVRLAANWLAEPAAFAGSGL